MATERQIAANRLNGLKGGVKTDAGKAISRLNARKHGIFASALTECDADGFFSELLDELMAELKPVGIVEQLLVDKLAVTYLRMRRCARAETLHFRAHWKFYPADFGKFPHNETVVMIGLYDARLTKQFLRLLHEIEERQKMRTAQRDHPQTPQIPQICSNERQEGEDQSSEGSVHNTELDSRLRGNDKREPRAAVEGLDSLPACAAQALHGNDESQVAAVTSKPTESAIQELKNEPNLSQVPIAAHDVNGQWTSAGG